MKIAVIAHSHYPIREPFSGGLEAHTHMLVKGLIAEGHDVTLFAAEGSDPSLNVHAFCRPTAKEIFAPTDAIVQYRENAYHYVIEQLKRSDFDIVHNNSLHYVPLHRAVELPMPIVTVLHTPPFIPMINGFRRAVFAPNHASIAVSDCVSDEWRKEIPGLVPTTIWNGVEFGDAYRGEKENRAVWFGRITPEKGTHLAIEACLKAGMPLTLCGPVYDQNYFDSVIAPLLETHAQDIVYRGSLKRDALFAEVARARVFVCTPCWEEPFGLVVAEALACGTPVAGFRRGALPEILDARTGVLVDADDADALARAIPHAARLSRGDCRDRADRHFAVARMIARYTAFYRDCRDGRQAHRRA
jgi:UDP-glucose:tetrahydrobiopterin glucosyltransferase